MLLREAESVPNILNMSSNQVNLQDLSMIQWPTVAQTGFSDNFAVFYNTFIEGDTEVFTDDTGTVIFPYASIFYSSTSDGGTTWTDPQPFMVNDPAAAQKFDYRFPMVPNISPTIASQAVYHCVFAVDTAAGHVDSISTPTTSVVPGFDVIGYAHSTVTLAVSGVSNTNGPVSLVLNPSYPDPFASSTTIDFTLPSESNVLLTVTDMLGRSVATLVDGRLGAGSHSAVFNGGNLADGVYRYTLQANGTSVSGSMSLLR